jgi:hypothetical protein
MRTYGVRAGYIPAPTLDLFDALVADFLSLPDLEPEDRVSCHAVCRALAARHEGATCTDGWFSGVGHDHSWLDLGNGIIADMYPIGATGPFLVDASHWLIPWNRLYIPHPTLLDEGGRDRGHHDRIATELLGFLRANEQS